MKPDSTESAASSTAQAATGCSAMKDDPTESAALLRAVVATAPDAIICTDIDSKICAVNPAAERLFGYTESELLGRHVTMLMPVDFREQHDAHVERYRSGGESRIAGRGRAVAGQHKDGSTFPAQLFIGEACVTNSCHFVGFIRDLSALDHEHRRVQELQSKLSHMSRLGEMGQLASALAHELTQPLAAIMNYTQAVRRISTLKPQSGFSESTAEIFEKIEHQAARAVDIIRRLRSFVQRHESERDDCDLRVLIEEALALALIGPPGQGVRVQLALMPGPVEVNVDRVEILQVLVNLVRNGIDAMAALPEREIAITTALHDRNFARVSVSDRGCGIAPEIATELFDSFVTTKTEGLGIGLTISKKIIEAHDGVIWCTPNEIVGTTFHFTVPLALSEREERE